MANIIADRLICWNADKTQLVEGNSPEGHYAAFNEGCEYSSEELSAAGAKWDGEKIVIPKAKSEKTPEELEAEKAAKEAAAKKNDGK